MRRITSGMLSLLAVAALAATPAALAQEEAEPSPSCQAPTFRAMLLTPLGGRIPRDASVVVGLFEGGSHEALPAVHLARRRRQVGLRSEAVAPGLYRLTPDARRIWGRYELEGVQGSPRLLFGRPGLPSEPPRPRLSRVERYLVASDGEPRTELRAHFEDPIPPTVVAIVSHFDEDDEADLWARAVPTRDDVVLWASGGPCPNLPEGASAPPSEGNVRVAFVDRYGQVSQPSEAQALP